MDRSAKSGPGRVAFFDFDGTLVRGNVVSRYAWIARRHPSRAVAAWRFGKAVLGVPAWLLLDAFSRRLFNVLFFRQYRGLPEGWLRAQAQTLFEEQVRSEAFRYARERVAMDSAAGYRTVLVSGGLDFLLAPAVEHFGLDDMLANQMLFHDGVATGEIAPPLLAGEEKAAALERYAAAHQFDMRLARAYSDSGSDAPMLRAVGGPVAANPDAALKRIAQANGWPVLDLDRSPEPLAQ